MQSVEEERQVRLTDTETSVLEEIARGKSTKEIATAMRASERTIEAHRRNIQMKMGAHNSAEAVSRAYQLRLLRVAV